MPNAVTALFGADSRPMEAEFAKQEVIAQRFGKTLQAVNAETYGAENAQMLRNRDALRALMAEKAAAIAEQERLNATLMASSVGGLGTPTTARAAEDAQMLRNRDALRALNAERIAAKAELERYDAALMANAAGLATIATANKAEDDELIRKSVLLKEQIVLRGMLKADAGRYALTAAGGAATDRMQNAADQEAWLVKLAAAKGISVETLKFQQAAKAAALESRGIATGLSSAKGHVPGLNLVLRETLVIFREIGRGNWARVPGSISLVIQGLRQMRGELGIFGALFTLTGALVVGSVAAIVASFFIWEHRVNALAKALETLGVKDIAPPDLTRLTAYEKGWNRIRDAIAEAVDEIHSANAAFETGKTLLDQSQNTEKRLLEIQKQKDIDEAGKDPAAKARVRADYIKKEHDLEKKQQQEKLDLDGKHIMALQKEQDDKIAAARAIKVATDEDEKTHQEIVDNAAKEGTEKKRGKKGEELPSQLEEDQATVEKLQGRRDFLKRSGGSFEDLGDDDKATLEAAQGRLAAHKKAVDEKSAFDLAKKDRDEARKEQTRLFEEAAKAGADKVKAAQDYKDALNLNERILSDSDKIRAAEGDEKDTKDDLKGESGHGYALNQQQRLGAYATTPPDFKGILEATKRTASNTDGLRPNPQRPPGSKPPQHGGVPTHK